MKPPFGVVDADGHINEPEARLLDFLEAPYRDWLHMEVPRHGEYGISQQYPGAQATRL